MLGVEYPFLTSQKNELFTRIKDSGFHPSDFDWRESSGGDPRRMSSTLAHGEYYFRFSEEYGRRKFSCTPGQDNLKDAGEVDDWDEMARWFDQWLANVKREL